MGLYTLAEVKLQLGKTSTADDTELQSYIDAATASVEDYCGAVVSATVTNEQHHVCGDTLVLRSERVVSMTSLTEYVGSTAYVLTEVATPALATTYSYMREGVVVRRLGSGGVPQAFGGLVLATYTAGFSSVPAGINLAARIIVQHLWETQRGGAVPTLSEDTSTPAGFAFAIPNRARELLDGYPKVSGIA